MLPLLNSHAVRTREMWALALMLLQSRPQKEDGYGMPALSRQHGPGQFSGSARRYGAALVFRLAVHDLRRDSRRGDRLQSHQPHGADGQPQPPAALPPPQAPGGGPPPPPPPRGGPGAPPRPPAPRGAGARGGGGPPPPGGGRGEDLGVA